MSTHLAGSAPRLIEVLGKLHRYLDGDKVTLVWDNLSAHSSRKMRAWIGTRRSWLVVEHLPPYAPDLNPVEALWTNLKGQELANLPTDSLDEVMAAAHRGIQRIRADWWLPYAFFPTLWDLVLVGRDQACRSG